VIAATAAGDTLFCRRGDGAVLVASEPGDDDPGWAEVPDGSVLTATPQRVSVTGLDDVSSAGEISGNERIAIT
jgi:gamma-glutamyl hercynylcysteine S-oxide hydrolase